MTPLHLLVLILFLSHAINALPAQDITTSLPEATDEISIVTTSPVEESVLIDKNLTDSQPGLLQRLLNLINFEKEPLIMPIPSNCTIPADSVLKTIEYQYLCYRIRMNGMARFNNLRQRNSSVKSYAEFRNLLFPLASEKNHPFFECAFDMFFNHMMNRTSFVWLHWALFDGSRFPFVRWQKVDVTKAGVVVAVKPGTSMIETETIPTGAQANLSWEDTGTTESFKPTAGISGPIDNNSIETKEEPAVSYLSETESPFWDEAGFMGSLRPLMTSARSLYSIYEHWAGFPRLQLIVSLL